MAGKQSKLSRNKDDKIEAQKAEAAAEEPKSVMDETPPEKAGAKHYRVICHTRCFWLNVLWDPGDIYDGYQQPPDHFSVDGSPPHTNKELMAAADDPRSTVEMLTTLRKKFGVEMPEEATRVEIFEALRQHEKLTQGTKSIKAEK